MRMQDISTMQLACEEREDFADFLDGLLPEQWEQPSLCELWRVRDVVAHVISYEELSRWRWCAASPRAGCCLPRRINAIGVAEYARRSPRHLVELMRSCIPPRGLTSAFGGMIALVDGMVHQQDIRRPLGIGRAIPPERLQRVLNIALRSPATRGARKARGVRLIAADLDWAYGDGLEVTGPGEALLMAMAARPDALNQLPEPRQCAFGPTHLSASGLTGRASQRPRAQHPRCHRPAAARSSRTRRPPGRRPAGC